MVDLDQPDVFRERTGDGRARVTPIELFFDLVFVFAVTQLSHRLLANFTPWGIAETALLTFAVWWVWIYTSWVTNWLNPNAAPVRLMLLVLMLLGLVMSTSLPAAFSERALPFVGAYVAMQVGRSLFMLRAAKSRSETHYRNFQRITAWLLLSSIFWTAGAFSEQARFGFWVLAIVIEFVSPSLGYWLPGLGRSETTDWDVEGSHLAERCGLFVIIALGESILLTGATFSGHEWTMELIAAFAVAFLGSITMWWIYFDIGAERASRIITHDADPGRIGRLAYTYIHVLIVAGIIVAAAADELTLAHPTGYVDFKTAFATIGGPALFIAGNLLFKHVTAGWPPLSHMVGLGLLALLIFAVPYLSPLGLGAAATAVLLVVAIWERRSLGPLPTETNHQV